MSKKEKQMADAVRIFEALSGVDEELLVRCEECADAVPLKKVRPIWYYGKAMAACLCFVVMGVVIWTVGPLISGKNETTNEHAVNPQMMEEEAVAERYVADKEAAAEAPAEDAVQFMDEKGESENSQIAGGANGGNSNSASSVTSDLVGSTQEEMESDKNAEMQQLQDPITKTDAGIAQEEGCPVDSREVITLEEAKGIALMGEYVPNTLPNGYAFESARKRCNDTTGEVESVSLSWTKGMDDIRLTISKVEVANIVTVDVARPETYDVHQYDIPYAASVPDAYRSSFNNPVFAEADFSRNIVKARMKVVPDQGDTNTPRGNFAVLYDSGILVEFSGDGDAESIYEMFSSMQQVQ